MFNRKPVGERYGNRQEGSGRRSGRLPAARGLWVLPAVVLLQLAVGCKEQPADTPAPEATPAVTPSESSPTSATPTAETAATPKPTRAPLPPSPRPAMSASTEEEDTSPETADSATDTASPELIEEIRNLCVEADLPVPPALETLPRDLAEVARDLAQTASRTPTAQTIGRLGFLYHAMARDRSDSDMAKVCYERARELDPKNFVWPYHLGRLFLTRGSHERARQEFNAALALNPKHHRIHFWLGRIDEQSGTAEEAKANYERYIAAEPELADGYAGVAAAELMLNDPTAAMAALDKALELDPNHGWAHQIRAAHYQTTGETERAREEMAAAQQKAAYSQALRHDPAELTFWQVCGPTRYTIRYIAGLASRGDDDSAKLLAEAVLSDYPNNVFFVTGIARFYMALGDLDRAAALASQASKLDADYEPTLRLLADMALRQGDFEAAVARSDEAIAASPNSAAAHAGRGRALASLGRTEEASAAMNRAARLDPANAMYAKAAGDLRLTLGDVAGAKANYISALETGLRSDRLPAHLVPALLAVADIEMDGGNADAAIRHLDRVLARDPEQEQVFQKLAGILLDLDRGQDALNYCQALIKRSPRTLAYQIARADLLDRNGHQVEALQHLQRVLGRYPQYAPAYYTAGTIHVRHEDWKTAANHFERVLQLDPQNLQAGLMRADCLSRDNREAEALAVIDALIDQLPDNTMLGNGRAWLLATCRDASVRNPAEAVAAAEKVCAATERRNPNFLDTLACAYAAAGRFDEAQKVAQEAINVGTQAGMSGAALTGFRDRMTLFKNNQPYYVTE